MREFLILIQVRGRQVKNGLEFLIRNSRLRLVTVVFTLLVIWTGIFWGLYRAFLFLQTFLGVGEILIDRLIYLLALGLFLMLVFSNAVVSFQLHYKARETGYLHTLPLSRSMIFWFLLLEAVCLSTWASVFLAFPAALAYGLTHNLPPGTYIAFPLFGLLLAILAAFLGTLAAFFIPPLLASRKLKVVTICLFLLATVAYASRSKAPPPEEDAPSQQVFLVNKLLKHTRVTLQPLLPSYWAAEGFLQFARGRYNRSLGFLAVLLVNTLFVWQIVDLTAGNFYYKTCLLYWGRGKEGRRRRRLAGRSSGRKPSDVIFGFLPPSFRAILLKDFKIFYREPAQWLQAAILFGLLTIYIVNIKHMPRNVYQPFWKNLITFFNLGATSFILATLTTRFVYPSLSLEGRTFWVLGLAPLPRGTIFGAKFWSSFTATLIVTETLMFLSNRILEVPGEMVLATCGAVFMMTLVLVSLAMGLGAAFPDFKQDNPARIASGFGGVLNLILSLVYIVIVVGLLAVTFHLNLVRRVNPHPGLIYWTGGFITLFSLFGTYLPLSLGNRALKKMEF